MYLRIKNTKAEQLFKFLLTPYTDLNFSNKITTQVKNSNVILNKACPSHILTKKNLATFPNELYKALKYINIPIDELKVWKCLFNIKPDKGEDFIPEIVYKNHFEEVKDYLTKSNISVVASEILIPYILLCGYTKINGVDILDKVGLKKITKIKWSIKSNAAIDYIISDGKTDRFISAKSNSSNYSTIITALKENDLKYNRKSELWSKIVKNIKECKRMNYNNSFTCWAIGSACMNLPYTLKELYGIYESVKAHQPISKKVYNTISKKGKLHLSEKDFNYYPYSLTNIFEKIAVNTMNEDIVCLKEIHKILFAQQDYIQIEMHTNTKNLFTVIIKTKDDNKDIPLKLINICGNKSTTNMLDLDGKKNLLVSGGGRGQFIGFKLL